VKSGLDGENHRVQISIIVGSADESVMLPPAGPAAMYAAPSAPGNMYLRSL
jgi:hypothetical protein